MTTKLDDRTTGTAQTRPQKSTKFLPEPYYASFVGLCLASGGRLWDRAIEASRRSELHCLVDSSVTNFHPRGSVAGLKGHVTDRHHEHARCSCAAGERDANPSLLWSSTWTKGNTRRRKQMRTTLPHTHTHKHKHNRINIHAHEVSHSVLPMIQARP